MGLWTDERACVFCKSLNLRIFYVRFLSNHSFSLTILFFIVNHFIKFFNLYSLLSEPIPATPYNFWHFIWFAAWTIFFRLNLFCIHFIFEFFCLQLTTFITNCTVSKRLFSLTMYCWFMKYTRCLKLMIFFLLANLRWRFYFL